MKRYAVFTSLLILAASPAIVRAGSTDSVRLDVRDGLPIVRDVFVNGHGPYRFLLDTGSTLNHIDARLARSIGLSVTFQTRLTTPAGVVLVDGTDGDSIRIGTTTADGQVFLMAGVADVQKTMPDVQGILGEVFLSRFDYTINMKTRSLDFGSPSAPANGTRLPFRINEGRPVVTTSLGSLVLDSGANAVVRFGVLAVDGQLEMMTTSGATTVGTIFSKLVVDGHTLWRGDAVALPATTDHGIDGLLPTRTFKSVFVSNSEGYMIVQ